MMHGLFLISGILQMTFAVLLGWPLVFLVAGHKRVGPFKNFKRLLQSHLDNIFMGVIQVALFAYPFLLPMWLIIALIISFWGNPQLFLIQAIKPEINYQSLPGKIFASFFLILITVSFCYLSYLTIIKQNLIMF